MSDFTNVTGRMPKMFLPEKSFLMSSGKLVKLHPVALPPNPRPDLLGVKDTAEAIDLLASIANAVSVLALSGWSFGITGIYKAIPIFFKLIPAIKGMGNIVAELDDLSPDEKQELIDLVKDKLLFKEDVEAVVSVALDILYKLKVLAGVFR